jgi:hypothetical protein
MNIIELAKEAGFVEDTNCEIYGSYYHLERAAALVRAEALEEAAKMCEAKQSYNAMHANTEFAAAIRGLK